MPTEVVVVMDIPEVDKFRGWTGPIGQSFGRLAKETVYWQRVGANKRTGAMAVGMEHKRLTLAQGIAFDAGSSKPYALFVDQGTKPHVITPKKPGGMLVFHWAKVGKTVFLRSVNHPGNRAYKFIQHGLEKALGVWNASG
jgi:hypothetical protein